MWHGGFQQDGVPFRGVPKQGARGPLFEKSLYREIRCIPAATHSPHYDPKPYTIASEVTGIFGG